MCRTSIPTTKPYIPENLKLKFRKCLEFERNIKEQQNVRMKNVHKLLNRMEKERKKRRMKEMNMERIK
jgi:hypothetical protein